MRGGAAGRAGSVLARLAATAVVGAALGTGVLSDARAADPEAGRRKAEPCALCHGADGNATAPGVPSLAGQPAMFTHWQLIKYRDGRRRDPQMSPLAERLSDADMADLAAFYAAQRPVARPAALDAEKVALGRQLAQHYHCTSCHRAALTGHEQVPRLAGQDLGYLLKQLRGFKAQTASDLDGSMTMAAQPVADAHLEPLAHFMASEGAPR